MEGPSRRKVVTAKVDFNNVGKGSRPVSPFSSSQSSVSTTIRPKAKVNSSATPLSRKPTAGTSSIVSAAPRARPTSPVRPPLGNSHRPTSSYSTADGTVPKARSTLSPNVLSRQRSLTNTNTSEDPFAHRNRRGSGSLHPQDIPLPFSPDPSEVGRVSSGSSVVSSPGVRVKAKVSGVATKAPASSVPSSPLLSSTSISAIPSFATTRVPNHRQRTSSIASALSISVPPSSQSSASGAPLYPITTAAPAANPHRYAPPHPPAHRYNPSVAFGSDKGVNGHDSDNDERYIHVTPKVDPAAVPLPPLSPPASSLSFSSRSSHSSLSHTTPSSASHSTAPNSHVNGLGIAERDSESVARATSTLDLLLGFMGDDPEPKSPTVQTTQPPANDPGSKIRAEAKSNRKIEDLEITNRSLLVINGTLEATKHKQAKEIRDLRRKLRESRLILPPRAYREVKSSLAAEEKDDEEDEEDEDDEEDGDEESYARQDETYRRVKSLIDTLLESGRKALESKPEDFREGGKGGKVLNPVELETWREDGVDDARSTNDLGTEADSDSEDELDSSRPSRITTPGIDEGDLAAPSKGEGEAATKKRGPLSSVPPITITRS